MKKFLTIIGVLCFWAGSVLAQTVQVSGTVTGADDGQPLPGVTVVVKGTIQGTVTDVNGRYSMNIPENATLQFSFVGMATVDIVVGDRQVVNVVMNPSAHEIEEVVVTALGISREKKSLGYATQEVKADELTKIRTGNVINSLSGRVAGIQVVSSSGQLGGGAKINIRGNTSLTGENQPLFVVDGIPISNRDYSNGSGVNAGYNQGNLAGDISPDDIESMNVLKGASATAMYGSRGANGVVVITTKKGVRTANKTLGVAVNSSVTFDQVSFLPKYQKAYGGGTGLYPVTINGKDYLYPDMDTDESWGEKFDPSILALSWNSFDEWDTENYLKPKPWVYPKNDYTTYYKTGVGYQNNIQVTGGDANYSFRLSYSNLNQTGIFENSKLNKNNLSFGGTAKISKLIDGFMSVNYMNSIATGRPETGYGDNATSRTMFQWTHTNLDYKDLKAYKNPDGTQRSWNRRSWNNAVPLFSNNPYWSIYENYESDRRDRVFGSGGLNIALADGLKLTGRGGIDAFMYQIERRSAVGSCQPSFYILENRVNVETSGDLFLNYNKRIADNQVGLSAMMGTSTYNRYYYLSGGTTVSGLVAPKVYNLTNSTVKATVYDTKNWKRINSVYGNITLDWNMLVYLDVTARNDWSSTLPSNNNSYFYPSFNLSFILSQLDALQGINWLSFAKLRAGYAEVGNDTNEYRLMNYFESQNPFGSNTRYSISTTLQNPNLRPERTKSWEVGAEAYFFQNRIGLDIAYYQKKSIDQIINAAVSGVTGYTTQSINTGELDNRGIEITINATPVKDLSGFSWDMQLNMTTLNCKVVSIADNVKWLQLGNNGFSLFTGAYENEVYPTIYGKNYVYGPKGEKLVNYDTWIANDDGVLEHKDNPNRDGIFVRTTDNEPLGKVTPSFTAGFSNTFRWKGLDLSVLFDMQTGGHIYYMTYKYGMGSGLLEETAQKSNVPGATGDVREDGWLFDGVYGKAVFNAETGKYEGRYTDAKGNEVSTPVANNTIRYADEYGYAFAYNGPDAMCVFKSDFIKLREVRLGYTLPQRYTGRVNDLRISVFGRNLATFMTDKNQKHFDPEYTTMGGSNAQGLEGGYVPTTRTFGFSIGFSF